MATSGGSFIGSKRRNFRPYCEMRIPGLKEKIFITKIKSREEGALCYDLWQLYIESGVGGVTGQKRKAVKLNYPEYSRTLTLEPLRSDCDIRNLSHKEEVKEIILKQAQAAAKNLPENLRRSTPVVGSPSPNNGSSSHQNVHGEPLVAKQDSPGVCTNLEEISELSRYCKTLYTSKVSEKKTLKRMVAGINKGLGYICPPEQRPNKFIDFMARFKQLIPGTLEVAEQEFKSEDSKCLELRKALKDHNLKVIEEVLMKDDNDSLGRQRANIDEWLQLLPEEQNE